MMTYKNPDNLVCQDFFKGCQDFFKECQDFFKGSQDFFRGCQDFFKDGIFKKILTKLSLI